MASYWRESTRVQGPRNISIASQQSRAYVLATLVGFLMLPVGWLAVSDNVCGQHHQRVPQSALRNYEPSDRPTVGHVGSAIRATEPRPGPTAPEPETLTVCYSRHSALLPDTMNIGISLVVFSHGVPSRFRGGGVE
uniref:Uncharacterized protein n=1 Tax=Anopheles atroparvus TaxID=41427 RepID=A0A182J8N7_ANOAO